MKSWRKHIFRCNGGRREDKSGDKSPKKTIGKDSCDGSSKASIKEARGDETQIKAIVCESSDFFLRRSVGP